jgi:hypothetical protein
LDSSKASSFWRKELGPRGVRRPRHAAETSGPYRNACLRPITSATLASASPVGLVSRRSNAGTAEFGRTDVTRLIIPFVLGVLGPIAIVGYLLLQN